MNHTFQHELSLIATISRTKVDLSFKLFQEIPTYTPDFQYKYSRVPNNSAARLLIFLNFSLPTRLIWTYTLIKFQEKILPTRLLCTYTVIDFSLFWLTRNICYLLTYTYLVLTYLVYLCHT